MARECFGEGVIVSPRHTQMACFDYPSSARSDFASSKSLVSKPSVNQS